MKKFITSVLVGTAAGISLGILFIMVAPSLPGIFEYAFYRVEQTQGQVAGIITARFSPATDQYFIPAVDATVSQEGKVIYADLGSMMITLFENGQQVGEYPIASVGREGTAWQTPIGQFEMSYKRENHFSSIGHVWMPYSMHFFGNYFIHGWPYYPDGTPVADGYSGGCIRLETPIAGEIYKFTDADTKLVVTTSANRLEQEVDFEYKVESATPLIEANFIVADLETGEVVAAKNANSVVPAGAFANIMNGLISLETLNQYQEAVFEQELMKVSDLLYSLLLTDSANAGSLLAGHKNKSQYIIDMNTRAKSLGMSATDYDDATGEAETTVTTLEDTFKMMQYVSWYKPFLIKVLSLDEYKINGREWGAIHPLKDLDGYVAGFSNEEKSEMITIVKFTPEAEKLIEETEESESGDKSENEKEFIIIVQGSPDARTNTGVLYEWLKGNVKVRVE